MQDDEALVLLGAAGVLFASFCVYMGHNSTLISSTFVFLGLLAGYIVGKKGKS